jgi:two-component system nitrogen regulation response regulator NtrX
MPKVLIVDDEENILLSLGTALELKGYVVAAASSFREGQECFLKDKPDIVILDVFLKGSDGLVLYREFIKTDPDVPIIMISGHADVEMAVRAIKEGAYDFVEKPIDIEKLGITIEHALDQRGLSREVGHLKEKWIEEHFFIGSSPIMQAAARTAEKAAPSNLTVLITGENGVGKEPMAYYIYLHSRRVGMPYIVINCAAIPAELFESELFGHKKGSFTGAVSDRPGFFAKADGGTLVLDEIAEIPGYLQPKILRAIENGEIQGIGCQTLEHVDVRVIAVTNRNLEHEIREGNFREDLFFRLDQVPLFIPPLRERREDIPGLVSFFSKEIQEREELTGRTFSRQAMEYLNRRDYRGNIRELRNLIERFIIFADSGSIDLEMMKSIDSSGGYTSGNENPFLETMSFTRAKEKLMRDYISAQLAKHNNSVKETAEALVMLPNNLSRKMRELGISSGGDI